MKKICEDCGKEFEAKESYHKRCWDCVSASRQGGRRSGGGSQRGSPHRGGGGLPTELKLNSFYSKEGSFLPTIYTDTSEKIANASPEVNPHDSVNLPKLQ